MVKKISTFIIAVLALIWIEPAFASTEKTLLAESPLSTESVVASESVFSPESVLSPEFSLSTESALSSESTFYLSHNPEASTALSVQDKKLTIQGLPKSEEFNYIIIKLIADQKVVDVKKSKNTRKGSGDASFNLSKIPKGQYLLEIYYSAKKYAVYSSYSYRQVSIEITDSAITFVDPLALSQNQEIFTDNRNDPNPLEHYLKPTPGVESEDPAIRDLAGAITAGASSEYDKARRIHDWVTQNIWYDYDAFYSGICNSSSAMETLTAQKGVCVGYASLTTALFRAMGIPAKMVTGLALDSYTRENWTRDIMADNKGNHVWNEAYVEGRWIILDTSYDSDNAYLNKEFSTGTGLKYRKYFDITVEFLSTERYILPREYDPLRSW
jgi:transglutaminase-like putative cysteine protease